MSTTLNDPELDAGSLEIMAHLEAHPFLDPENMTPPQMRRAFDDFYATVDMEPAPSEYEDRSFQGRDGARKVRIYWPESRGHEKLPVVLFIRGGGLVMGSLDSYDRVARRICWSSSAIVVAIDYRQPPEHKFPSALNDCYDALRWIRENAGSFGGDCARVAIAGDSGGGMLAASVTHVVKDAGDPDLDFQFLIYPAVGFTEPSASMREFERGYVFYPEQLDWLYAQYLPEGVSRNDPLISPALRSSLAGLPPALIVTAHFDIFRDDAELYGERLRKEGVPVEIKRYETVLHGFLNMGGKVPTAAAALDYGGKALRRRFRQLAADNEGISA